MDKLETKKIYSIVILVFSFLIIIFLLANNKNKDYQKIQIPTEGQVYKEYDDGYKTTLEEEYIEAQVYDKDLYVTLKDKQSWMPGVYDPNIIKMEVDDNYTTFKITGLCKGDSEFAINAWDNKKVIRCKLNIRIREDLTPSLTGKVTIENY